METNKFEVLLRSDNPNCIVSIDYRQLNWFIREYNKKLWRCVDFWEWLSYELFEDEYHIVGFRHSMAIRTEWRLTISNEIHFIL